MANFKCEYCGTDILENEDGIYVTFCDHYPLEHFSNARHKKDDMETIELHRLLIDLHARAIACHCECLGMNAENAMAVCCNYTPPYNDAAYFSVMKKWGLMTEEGKPNINT